MMRKNWVHFVLAALVLSIWAFHLIKPEFSKSFHGLLFAQSRDHAELDRLCEKIDELYDMRDKGIGSLCWEGASMIVQVEDEVFVAFQKDLIGPKRLNDPTYGIVIMKLDIEDNYSYGVGVEVMRKKKNRVISLSIYQDTEVQKFITKWMLPWGKIWANYEQLGCWDRSEAYICDEYELKHGIDLDGKNIDITEADFGRMGCEAVDIILGMENANRAENNRTVNWKIRQVFQDK